MLHGGNDPLQRNVRRSEYAPPHGLVDRHVGQSGASRLHVLKSAAEERRATGSAALETDAALTLFAVAADTPHRFAPSFMRLGGRAPYR